MEYATNLEALRELALELNGLPWGSAEGQKALDDLGLAGKPIKSGVCRAYLGAKKRTLADVDEIKDGLYDIRAAAYGADLMTVDRFNATSLDEVKRRLEAGEPTPAIQAKANAQEGKPAVKPVATATTPAKAGPKAEAPTAHQGPDSATPQAPAKAANAKPPLSLREVHEKGPAYLDPSNRPALQDDLGDDAPPKRPDFAPNDPFGGGYVEPIHEELPWNWEDYPDPDGAQGGEGDAPDDGYGPLGDDGFPPDAVAMGDGHDPFLDGPSPKGPKPTERQAAPAAPEPAPAPAPTIPGKYGLLPQETVTEVYVSLAKLAKDAGEKEEQPC